MLSQPTTAETAAPTTMASISPAGTPSKAASALLRRPAPRIAGVAKHEGEPRGLLSRESTRHRRRNGDAGARPAGHQRDRLSAAHPSGVGSVSATKLTATARKPVGRVQNHCEDDEHDADDDGRADVKHSFEEDSGDGGGDRADGQHYKQARVVDPSGVINRRIAT